MFKNLAFSCAVLVYLARVDVAYAEQQINTPEKNVEIAKLLKESQKLPEFVINSTENIQFSVRDLSKNKLLSEQLLNRAIETGNLSSIEYLLTIYRQFPNTDPILILFAQAQIAKTQQQYTKASKLYRDILALKPELTPVRIQLAIVLFQSQQDKAAKEQFEKALSEPQLPIDIEQLIHLYLQTLEQRNAWQLSLSANYLREDNVNNVSGERYIENTAFIKGESMLPQKAQGIGYYFGLERDINLWNAHYFHIENSLYGKSYWDQHDYDDITNRLSLGYVHKGSQQRFAILPFYEQQWYGGHRYKRSNGGRIEFNRWLTSNWQFSTAAEYAGNFYSNSPSLNGKSKLASLTILWRASPRSYFYLGTDYAQERTRVRHYGYDLKTARIGWGQEWRWGISSRLSFSASTREYKDNLLLGSAFHFDKRREDRIYHINATVWKRDWHLWGITPKLNYHWKKQRSNFASLYSYSDKSVNVLLEKTF
ncbi:surface lipoprotein assembly modifier [Actinobacillus equuli]|uniref:TPR repeat-containing protein NMB0313 n=1 Tax=Actinobacillus equuli TaxID=718 RepID=A0AAX3FLW1_ACTEU|nr:surface lipoprotein assembly modifier [Actinobacillus equuli]AIZ78340.1 membrane protein [Actinobacillus equuli subsp. equuli]WGE44612.1 surface lipoprotein assembly modifier [Actinobacillus equuli subsp. equuli]VEE92131.1 TPR repeat-containing protein NMB0313 precursor [Actinobacillus equuli]